VGSVLTKGWGEPKVKAAIMLGKAKGRHRLTNGNAPSRVCDVRCQVSGSKVRRWLPDYRMRDLSWYLTSQWNS